jgi:hypothetical protein
MRNLRFLQLVCKLEGSQPTGAQGFQPAGYQTPLGRVSGYYKIIFYICMVIRMGSYFHRVATAAMHDAGNGPCGSTQHAARREMTHQPNFAHAAA